MLLCGEARCLVRKHGRCKSQFIKYFTTGPSKPIQQWRFNSFDAFEFLERGTSVVWCGISHGNSPYPFGNCRKCNHLFHYASEKTLQKEQLEFLYLAFVCNRTSHSPTDFSSSGIFSDRIISYEHVAMQTLDIFNYNIGIVHFCHSSRDCIWPIPKYRRSNDDFQIEEKACPSCFAGLVVLNSYVHPEYYKCEEYLCQRIQWKRLQKLSGEDMSYSTRYTWPALFNLVLYFRLFCSTPCYFHALRKNSNSITPTRQRRCFSQSGYQIKEQGHSDVNCNGIWVLLLIRTWCCFQRNEILWLLQKYLVHCNVSLRHHSWTIYVHQFTDKSFNLCILQ